MISILLLIYFSSLLLRPTNVKNLLKLLGGFRLQTNIVLVFVFFTVFREKWLF